MLTISSRRVFVATQPIVFGKSKGNDGCYGKHAPASERLVR